MGIIGSAALLLDWQAARTGDDALAVAAAAIRAAVASVVADGVSTTDLGGSATTAQFAAAVLGLV
jgi:3-isopropylmalate dehydrogenase